jgi:hypothetical protein
VRAPLVLIGLLLLGPQTATPDRAVQANGDRAAARAVLHDVLSQRAFSHARGESWIAQFRRGAEEWLSDLWGRLFGNRFVRPSTTLVLAWVVSIAAVCVLIVWLWRIARRRRDAEPFELRSPARDERAWRDAAQRAAELIRAGQIREGARLAYGAAVRRLEEDGAFTHDATRTPREHLRLVPEQHRRRPALSRMTTAFERIWYGSRDASADEGHDIVRLLQELECLPREPAN